MATFNHVSGQEPSTVTFKLATVTQTRNSSAMHQEIMALGDPDTSNAIAAVLAGTPASTAWGLVTRAAVRDSTVFQGTSPWVIAGNSTVAPLAGSTWATRPIQSSAADLQMTATPAAGSTWATRPIQSSAADLQMTATPVAGSTWRTQPGSTLWASSAGFHFNSSGELQTVATISISSLSSIAGVVAVAPYSTQNSSVYLPVRISNGTAYVTPSQDYADGSTASGVTGPTILFDNGSNATMRAVSLSLGLPVNLIAGQSTTVAVSSIAGAVIVRSSAANALMSVYQSSAAELQATVTPAAGSTWSVRPLQSSAADLLVTATIGANLQSTAAPSSNSSGLIVRQVVDNILTFASTSVLASTSQEVQSSGANLRTYVTAYTITSTNQTAAQWGFYSSNATLLWPLTLAALSSGVAGANLAVSPPGYLFRTVASDALNFKTAGSTVAAVQFGCSYFRAP